MNFTTKKSSRKQLLGHRILNKLGFGGYTQVSKSRTSIADKSVAGKFSPALSLPLSVVTMGLRPSKCADLLVNGDATFFTFVKTELPQARLTWISTDYRDVESGAIFAGQTSLVDTEAVVCGGLDVAARW